MDKDEYKMNKLPLVSVIVPVYNVEKYIRKCLESIIQQNYENLEIIIVDDGSPDDSGNIADEYAVMDSRIRVTHQRNSGVAAARNKGMKTATGEFILFVDSDDWISADHIEYLMKLQRLEDADMCMTTEFFVQKSDRQTKEEIIVTIRPDEAAVLLLSPKMVVGSYNKLFRRSFLIDNSIYQNEKLFSGEGLHFIVTAAEHANYVTVSNRKIYYYRRNVPQSATTKFNIEMYINNELSLDLLEKEKIVGSKQFDSMLNLFRVHLKISGLLAILTYASRKQYLEEYRRWKKEIRYLGTKMVLDHYVPLRSKVRIVCVNISPRVWSKLAQVKRERIFKRSV